MHETRRRPDVATLLFPRLEKEPFVTTSVLNATTTVESPATDLENRERLAANLTAMLADAYVLMVKTQGFHWNVVGPLFVSLHELTEQ